ncbi:25245_t:CDS:1 [Gigaspora margarita]|uniref:25245_t:CDS:1 n=1 Tax=Gigaspora margarita TaxID=4874 RepID=A0ABN7V5B8_GIGMA|nr:25245_t:CDS:1 [Gigaspora margarita]
MKIMITIIPIIPMITMIPMITIIPTTMIIPMTTIILMTTIIPMITIIPIMITIIPIMITIIPMIKIISMITFIFITIINTDLNYTTYTAQFLKLLHRLYSGPTNVVIIRIAALPPVLVNNEI